MTNKESAHEIDKGATRVCPRCGATMVPVEYGMPGPEMQEASARGEIILGGCCIIEGASPEWGCPRCLEAAAREEELLWGGNNNENLEDAED